jgi:type IV pilus assembly protein PilX
MMRNHRCQFARSSKQNGVVMFVALILLLILSLLGVTAARMQTVEERMARNDGNRQLGQQAAEAALRAAEVGVLTGTYFNFAGNANGLYQPDWVNTGSALTGMNWSSGAVITYAGPPLLSLPPASQTPKFMIEQLPSVAAANDDTSMSGLTNSAPVTVYRVTAKGVGADNTSTTTLQSIVR